MGNELQIQYDTFLTGIHRELAPVRDDDGVRCREGKADHRGHLQTIFKRSLLGLVGAKSFQQKSCGNTFSLPENIFAFAT